VSRNAFGAKYRCRGWRNPATMKPAVESAVPRAATAGFRTWLRGVGDGARAGRTGACAVPTSKRDELAGGHCRFMLPGRVTTVAAGNRNHDGGQAVAIPRPRQLDSTGCEVCE